MFICWNIIRIQILRFMWNKHRT